MNASSPQRRWWQRRSRFAAAILALLAYLILDAAMLTAQPGGPQWDVAVNGHGTVTWVDPNGPAQLAGVIDGDELVRPRGAAGLPFAGIVRQSSLRVRHDGHVRVVRIAPAFGPTQGGQALVLVGALFLLVGGLARAAGRHRRAGDLLGAVSAAVALTLLGAAWGYEGYTWALRLTFFSGVILFPVAWAAFLLSFPRNVLGQPRWRRAFGTLCCLAALALLAYALCFAVDLPYGVAVALAGLVFIAGLLLGLTALAVSGHSETAQAHQQRRLMLLSATAAVLPMLLFSFVPLFVFGHPLLPFTATTLALAALPLGLCYAILRYDLMELDVVVRRVVAWLLGSLSLVTIAYLAGQVLQPLLPRLDVGVVAVAVLAGASGGRYVSRWAYRLVEHALAPELRHSRRLVAGLDPLLLQGDRELAALAATLEGATQALADASWTRLLVRRRGPGAVFWAPCATMPPVSLPLLAARLTRSAWGLSGAETAASDLMSERATLCLVLEREIGALIPLRMRGEVIGVLAVGERRDGEPLHGPDREALAVFVAHFALAIDHACVRADLEDERATAALLSASNAAIAQALDELVTLPQQIIHELVNLRDVRGAALLLYRAGEEPLLAATRGATVSLDPPREPSAIVFDEKPYPRAWLPLTVADEAIGVLCIRWNDDYIVGEHDRRLLTVYANGAAMALEHARLYERARVLAERDPVTDLYNHRAYHTRLEAALEQARAGGQPVGVLLVDLADFKLFNDTHGHQAGDQALRRVGEVLQACCRTSDAAARLGGDEFAMVLPDADLATTRAVAERLTDMAAISTLVSPEGQALPVRLTIGLAAFPVDADKANALLARADERLYEAKRAGVAISTAGSAADRADEGHGSRFGILEALVAMVDNRDRYTGEHSEQVATYACALGAELGLSHDTIETLRLAGLLHDVGKIGVPDRILRKPSKLTDEEFDVVRRHVDLSEALLAVVSQDRDLMDAVRHHHERWDGRGYPRGVAGEAVPLLGRIMIVADAVSAMGMDRPYRKGLSWEQVSQELTRGAGAQFDPALVKPALRSLQPYIERTQAA